MLFKIRVTGVGVEGLGLICRGWFRAFFSGYYTGWYVRATTITSY